MFLAFLLDIRSPPPRRRRVPSMAVRLATVLVLRAIVFGKITPTDRSCAEKIQQGMDRF